MSRPHVFLFARDDLMLKFSARLPAMACLAVFTASVAAHAAPPRAAVPQAPPRPPVRVRQSDAAIVVENGIVALTIQKASGEVTSMTYRPDEKTIPLGDGGPRAVYWDANAVPAEIPPSRVSARPKGDYCRPVQCMNFVRVVSADTEMADVVVDAGPSEWFPFHVQYHYVLRRGLSGFYAYSIFRHGKGMPAAILEQTRITIRAEKKGAIFTDQFVDDARKGPPPSSKIISMPQDATYRLADGSAYTKYDNTQFIKDLSAAGMAGHGVGLWFVWPSTEFVNGGPLRQELTVQIDNIMQAMFQGEHFGGAPVNVAADETWAKCYGPVLVYMNHGGTNEALWQDARDQATKQQRAWPFLWMQNDEYPLRRGTVQGRVVLHNGGADKVGGAWVVLASDEPGEKDADWGLRAKGYEFWTHAADDGQFRINNVRPGTYTLFVSGADQFEDFRKTGVSVAGRKITALGDLDWNAVAHGQRLWQIGTADRSTAEFHDGAPPAYRNYDTFLKYFKAFPHDVTFTIGGPHPSAEANDWEYAQWNWYNEKPYWTIRFSLQAGTIPAKGKATLTLGIASAQPAGDILVGVNGKNVAKLVVAKTGTAGYRSGAQDSRYTLRYVTFDGALLKAGPNEITLGQSDMQKFSPTLLAKEKRPTHDVMYDAIRLEVEKGP